jgi:L-amino acid N-acyltransferase YncA
MRIRPAALPDIPEIQAIYAHHVLTGTGTFEEVPPSVEEMAARFATLTDAGAIWRVAADATGVLGYAYAARYHTRSAYRFTAEDSVYVRDDQRGRGVGRALLAELIAAATAAGFRQMLAVIGDSGNAASIACCPSTWAAPRRRSALSMTIAPMKRVASRSRGSGGFARDRVCRSGFR